MSSLPLGMTEYIKGNFAATYQQVHFSASGGKILVIDQNALAEHLCTKFTSRSPRDGSTAHAFSTTCGCKRK